MNDRPHFIYWKTEALKGAQGPRAKNRDRSLGPRQPARSAHNGRVQPVLPGSPWRTKKGQVRMKMKLLLLASE